MKYSQAASRRPYGAQKRQSAAGRVDVLAFRLIMRGIQYLEQRSNVHGLGEAVRPGVEAVVAELLPARPIFRRRRRLC